MRVTGGTHRGRLLHTPKGRDIRPTTDKVRQAVFNMLHARGAVQGAFVLDAFCGTGALGLEALSQGAAFAVFLDKSRESLNLCQDNVIALEMQDRVKLLLKNACKPGDRPEGLPVFNLVFLDPPYRQDLVARVLPVLTDHGWIASNGLIVLEMDKADRFADLPGCEGVQEKTYGDTKIILLQRRPE